MPPGDANAPSRGGLRPSIALAAVAAVALGLWLWLRDDGEPRERPRGTAPAEVALPAERAAPREPRPKAPAPAEEHEHAEEEPHKPGDHPHPITSEHLRIYRENNFMHTIDNAILVKDYEGVRRLNSAYKKEYPLDEFVVQEAYEIIADCLEKKTPERVARARAFWEKRRSSRARRDMRKLCLE